MWCEGYLSGCSIDRHRLLLLFQFRALSPFSLVVLSFLVVILFLALNFRWLLSLFVVVVVQLLGQSLGIVERFRFGSDHISLDRGGQSLDESFDFLSFRRNHVRAQ